MYRIVYGINLHMCIANQKPKPNLTPIVSKNRKLARIICVSNMKNCEFEQKALQCLKQTYDLIEATDWKVEKVTKRGETICSLYRKEYGKIYKLTSSVDYPAKALCHEIFHNVENTPKWNPNMLEAKTKRKINSYIALSNQAICSCGGGLIQSRDFANLCSWRLFDNGKISDEDIQFSQTPFNENSNTPLICPSQTYKVHSHQDYHKNGRMWLNAAVSVEDDVVPPVAKYIRGDNLVSGFGACEVEENPNVCIFEWIICLDLKGCIPRCILDKSYTSFMADYMIYLHKHVENLRQEGRHLYA